MPQLESLDVEMRERGKTIKLRKEIVALRHGGNVSSSCQLSLIFPISSILYAVQGTGVKCLSEVRRFGFLKFFGFHLHEIGNLMSN
jgi:hypothetical protein